ncbi:Hsp20/alpha crystallin family protein [Diaphorobacter caeni]|uniref:Hsp20/alpha crystallin family protein n=1 Tax=Diaphorobacter caeni TaxID=2784387 RepID=UPI00188EF620|nr:Hsp20/alpha crystallin family protein [Diaphorobacter caeni]MBF5006451.1 Hsp20/alpha crystallin family protein [Diaphorobacter caeni]
MIFAPVIGRHAAFGIPRVSDEAVQRFLRSTLQSAAPEKDVHVSKDDNGVVTLQLDVPGLSREQLQIRIEGKQVHLSSIEGAPRNVRRSWELADEIDASASGAKLENGVLTLTLSKLAPVDKSVQLAIN